MNKSTFINTLKGLFCFYANLETETGLKLYRAEDGTFILSLLIDNTGSSVEGKTPDEVIQKALDKWFE